MRRVFNTHYMPKWWFYTTGAIEGFILAIGAAIVLIAFAI